MDVIIEHQSTSLPSSDPLRFSHPCTVVIKWEHNHSIHSMENLINLNITNKTREIYYELFETMSPGQAFHRHQMDILASEGSHIPSSEVELLPMQTFFYIKKPLINRCKLYINLSFYNFIYFSANISGIGYLYIRRSP